MSISRYRRRRKADPIRVALNRPAKMPGPEVLPWYWHPGRLGAGPPPAAFAKQMREIDPDLRAVFSPVHERFLIWVKSERVQHPLCRGWLLLFIWEDPVTHEFLPLNELVFHNLGLIAIDRFPNTKTYFDKIQKEVADRKKARVKDADNERKDFQADFLKSTDISTAGRGNKFALHHAGTVIPTAQELAWRAQTRKTRLPKEILDAEAREKERLHEAGRL